MCPILHYNKRSTLNTASFVPWISLSVINYLLITAACQTAELKFNRAFIYWSRVWPCTLPGLTLIDLRLVRWQDGVEVHYFSAVSLSLSLSGLSSGVWWSVSPWTGWPCCVSAPHNRLAHWFGPFEVCVCVCVRSPWAVINLSEPQRVTHWAPGSQGTSGRTATQSLITEVWILQDGTALSGEYRQGYFRLASICCLTRSIVC